ncbi:uncharacterized protein LOC126906411 [Daktulosphaira vitifoliae]|uniref:uncharacterized protein LOC126906411 n=1 Tax=Daktulosphaira vitifoliae TaxID=58002 RepID=UPI0021AAA481|nr:uncharacterized protein LOC126906411 [Daktulosphaira vitifoliae]
MDLTYLIVVIIGVWCTVPSSLSLPAPSESSTTSPSEQSSSSSPPPPSSNKRGRSLFHQPSYLDNVDYNSLHFNGGGLQNEEEDLLSNRGLPAKPDSPVYFIRLPPQPYVFVPGYGYVSQPTRLEPPPFLQRPTSPFLNLPLEYVSNAKPVGMYTLPQKPQKQNKPKPQRRPPTTTTAPDSNIYNLNKGPYDFNGRPSDVFLLQSAYDNLYSEVLQNIYP